MDRWRGWAHTVEGSKVKRRRSLSLGELKGRMLQAGKRSEKAKVSEEALLTRSSKAKKPMNA